ITGSVYGSNWQHVKIAIILSVILLFICFVALKNMNIQVLGEDIAAGAGSAVQRNRFFLLLLSTALTGCAVSVAGTI
ncbi:iron chelate uptake ABC transporter family permease subunit, partial [Staphylococcus aureus]